MWKFRPTTDIEVQNAISNILERIVALRKLMKTVFTEEVFVFFEGMMTVYHDVYTPGVYTLHKKY